MGEVLWQRGQPPPQAQFAFRCSKENGDTETAGGCQLTLGVAGGDLASTQLLLGNCGCNHHRDPQFYFQAELTIVSINIMGTLR